MIRGVLALVVQVLAVLVYSDERRRDRRSWKRILTFWMGFPWTLVSLAVVEPDPAAELEESEELGELLREIRRDREERGAPATVGPGGTRESDAEEGGSDGGAEGGLRRDRPRDLER